MILFMGFCFLIFPDNHPINHWENLDIFTTYEGVEFLELLLLLKDMMKFRGSNNYILYIKR